MEGGCYLRSPGRHVEDVDQPEVAATVLLPLPPDQQSPAVEQELARQVTEKGRLEVTLTLAAQLLQSSVHQVKEVSLLLSTDTFSTELSVQANTLPLVQCSFLLLFY